MKDTRIVITGMGAVTPIGIGVEPYWNNLIAGKCGVGRISQFDPAALPVKIAAEVRDFDAAQYIPKPMQGKLARFSEFAFVAANEALAMSGLTVEPHRTGLVMGTAMSGVVETAATQTEYDASTRKKVTPRFVPKILGNMAACHIAIAHDIQGPSFTVSTACSSGIDAITLAATLLRAGAADAMLAVGGESIACNVTISSLANAHALSRREDDPQLACRPFDKGRDGFVIGEGGGALLLETEAHAKARGAVIYGEVLGCANNNDAFHVTLPRPGGEGGAHCMALALESAGLRPEDVDYINAHGTSTVAGDTLECAAIHAVFGENPPPVSSTKGATGHLMGAGGITETIACLLAIRDGILPPTLNYTTPDPECDIDCVPNTARKAKVDVAMTNALGFGGQNASLIVGRYRG